MICQWRANQLFAEALRQIIELRDTDKTLYFAITEFNNSIIHSITKFVFIFNQELIYFIHFLAAQGSDLLLCRRERRSNYVWAEYYYLQQNTFRRHYAWEDRYICRQLFAGHVVGSQEGKGTEEKNASNELSNHKSLKLNICNWTPMWSGADYGDK